jgi:hypothetical protein
MPIGSSPFLTADVDETFGISGHRGLSRAATASDIVSARIDLIRRRVVAGYYSSPAMATEVARRLLDPEPPRPRE